MTRSERPLSTDERAHLEARLANARRESAGALVKTGAAAGLVCAALALLTILASDAPRLVIVGFWVALWLVLTLWIGLPGRRLMRQQIPILEDGLRTNRTRVIRVRSSRVVEFEEEEDEGACYAFDVDGSSTLFIVGQEFYEDDDFPNSDFSMVEVLGGSGRPIDVLTQKHGRKIQPERVVPAAIKNELQLPEHLEVVAAPVDAIETGLPRASSR